MKSKSQILDEHMRKTSKEDRRLRFVGPHIHNAMEDYAKQEAIALEDGNSYLTDEQLYNLYLESKKQKV